VDLRHGDDFDKGMGHTVEVEKVVFVQMSTSPSDAEAKQPGNISTMGLLGWVSVPIPHACCGRCRSVDLRHGDDFDKRMGHTVEVEKLCRGRVSLEPFARNGYVDLFDYDGIAPEDGERVRIDIKQLQLEQDTARLVVSARMLRPLQECGFAAW
jgi:hypothetical protein